VSDGPRYRFGPLERRGLIAGWRGGQIVSVVLGLMVAVAALRDHSGGAGVVVALVAVLGGLGVACWPVGGRTAEEWAPTVARWCADGLAGRRRQLVEVAGRGRCTGTNAGLCGAGCSAGDRRRATGVARPGGRHDRVAHSVFGGLRILEVGRSGALDGPGGSPGGDGVAVVHDRHTGTCTAVLQVASRSFALLGAAEQDRRVAAWASVLASLARERPIVRRLQWVASSHPDDGRAVRDDLVRRAALPETAPAHRSYRVLLDQLGAGTCRHEVLLALQVRSDRSLRRPGARTDACATLLREVEALRRMLGDTDVEVVGLLGVGALGALCRAARQPGASGAFGQTATGGTPSDDRRPASLGAPGAGRTRLTCAMGWPWPLAVRAHWDRVQADGVWQAAYWVAEWPRVEVAPDFLAPLLLGSVRRTVSLVMEPLSPTRAMRQVERARTADLADSELRRRGGFLATARRAREAEVVVQREAELADGHASFRFSGYVTVRAASSAALDQACEATEQAAGQAHLELRRLYGDQDRALLHGLPLCTGLT
jgi:hypothetical protein